MFENDGQSYYQDGAITIYNADCRDISILSSDVDLLLTDPPYGVSYEVQPQVVGHGNRRIQMGGKPPVYGDDKPFDPSHLLMFNRIIMFGANHYSDQLPVSGGWFVWDKTGGGRGPDNTFADVELAWTNLTKTPTIYHHLWKGLVRDSEAGEKVLHPTQKPVALMTWLLEKWSKPGDLVYDPYMGCGPVAVACQKSGRRYVGCEIMRDYCDVTIKRLAQRSLFAEV